MTSSETKKKLEIGVRPGRERVSPRTAHTHRQAVPLRVYADETDRRMDGVQQCVIIIIIIIIIKRQLISRRNMPEDITRARNVRPRPLYAPIQ